MLTVQLEYIYCIVGKIGRGCHAKTGPLFLVLPGLNISKYLDPPDNIFEIFGPPGTKFSDIFGLP